MKEEDSDHSEVAFCRKPRENHMGEDHTSRLGPCDSVESYNQPQSNIHRECHNAKNESHGDLVDTHPRHETIYQQQSNLYNLLVAALWAENLSAYSLGDLLMGVEAVVGNHGRHIANLLKDDNHCEEESNPWALNRGEEDVSLYP